MTPQSDGFILAIEWVFSVRDHAAGTAVRRALVEALTSLACDPLDLASVQLVYGELASNAMRYSTSDNVRVSFAWRDDEGELVIRSSGERFEFRPAVPPVQQEHGRGHLIVATLAQDVRIEHEAGVNSVRVRLHVRQRAGEA